MLATAHAFTIDGLSTRHVTVEVDVRAGLPAFAIVGLADTAVREARERIQAAIRNCGFEFPARRITANLAPGDLPKAGPGLDLALACALLAAGGQLDGRLLQRSALFGELALDGSVRPTRGALAVAEATRRAGLEMLVLSSASVHEAHLIDGLRVAAVGSLASAVRVLRGGTPDRVAARESVAGPPDSDGDLGEVIGQRSAVQALVIAAAGGHNCLLSGPPGTGKTMLAQRLASILPPLTPREAVEVTRIHDLSGARVQGLASSRPFRAPHHSITAAGLIGGAQAGWAGEVVLAHNGVLFLDELSEFSRTTLDALRQPMEDGRVAIARARHSAVYPARFMLLAATNPCPCGYHGEEGACRCSEAELMRHRRRLSGPLLDRIDILAHLQRPQAPPSPERPPMTSREALELVIGARERQARRLSAEDVELNAHMSARVLAAHVHLDGGADILLACVRDRRLLSARGEARMLRVARTIADLDGSERVRRDDLAAALSLRHQIGSPERCGA